MLICPEELTGSVTRFATVAPAVQFRFDASGWAWPVGQTVRKPAPVVSVTVTLATTAETPAEGTPPSPVTCRVRVLAAPSVLPVHWSVTPETEAARVSQSLKGGSKAMLAPTAPGLLPSVNQPSTSTTTSVAPEEL